MPLDYPTKEQVEFVDEYVRCFGENKKIVASMDKEYIQEMCVEVEEDGARYHCFVDPFGNIIGDWVW